MTEIDRTDVTREKTPVAPMALMPTLRTAREISVHAADYVLSATGPARSWLSPPTTNATSTSRRSTGRAVVASAGVGGGNLAAYAGVGPMVNSNGFGRDAGRRKARRGHDRLKGEGRRPGFNRDVPLAPIDVHSGAVPGDGSQLRLEIG